MAHAVHTTKAIVLGSAEVQDANKLYWLLTEDFGLLFASARSVREEVSKLRYALQDLAFSRVSLVRGRGIWRITGAEDAGAEGLDIEQGIVFGRVSRLARRLMPTDEENPELFTILINAREALSYAKNEPELIESITVARVLYQLGYLSCEKEYEGVVDTLHFDVKVTDTGEALQKKLVERINIGLEESQL